MRGWVAVGSLVVTILLLTGGAMAHAAGTEVTIDGDQDEDVRTQSFERAFCLPTCQSDARGLGNLPPAIVAESGTTLTWRSADFIYHTATSETETRVDQGSQAVFVALGDDQDGDACLDLSLSSDGVPVGALFEIREDGLYVTDDVGPTTETTRCDEAGALPDGSYAFKLHCQFHPKYQHQLVVITPAEE